jgi:hypothetical protein
MLMDLFMETTLLKNETNNDPDREATSAVQVRGKKRVHFHQVRTCLWSSGYLCIELVPFYFIFSVHLID